ncbi:kinase-like domain-containing protein [Cadophora sp. MPI-SDFR-AT-0126]|nr:kinase-like domain-containing protein [Leotiomycetes sp. MPI-SDFR-AT-0126]
MAGHGDAATFYNEYLWWENYNDPNRVPSTIGEINQSYGLTPFVLPAPVSPPDPLPVPELGPPVQGVAERRQVVEHQPTEDELALLERLPGLGNNVHGGPNWKGVKHLGSGAGGSVCLWEYIGPPAGRPPTPHDKVVIKLAHYTNTSSLRERNIFWDMGMSGSHHIVKMLDTDNIIDEEAADAQGLDPVWIGFVRRIVLEYCPSGTLEDLKDLRIQRNVRLEELTLWKIFDCLVDGCAVMEHRMELTFDVQGNAHAGYSIGNHPDDPGVLVHFDLKPPNIMVMRNEAVHRDTPLCKVGDFGLALYRRRDLATVHPHDAWDVNEELRRRGTLEYLAPEQFSPRWNHSDYMTSPVCGKFGTQTNVWGIGQIMYETHVDHTRPFTPNPLHGNPATGRAFGTEIQATSYSAMFRDTIQECLYEIPTQRPTLQVLKDRCKRSITALENAGVAPEGWQDLERLEPLTALAAETDAALAREDAGQPVAPVGGNRRGRFRKYG